MWLNAYRLAGSTNMLIVRATKGADMNYVKPLNDDQSSYIVRDGQLLKQINKGTGFSLTIDRLGGDSSNRLETGWAISINEIGIIGNLVGDNGPVYEYFASDLRELVEYLNGTSKFFCPNPKYYALENGTWKELKDDDTRKPDSVYFKEVYLAHHFIDETGFNRFYESETELGGTSGVGTATDTYVTKADGLAYLLVTTDEKPQVTGGYVNSTIINLNDNSYSGADYPDEGYLVNTFNSNSEIKIRIRRFNHDAVILRDDVKPTVVAGGDSPFEVITEVVDQYTRTINADSTSEASKRIIERDFYEVAVLDPSLDKDPLSFCVGNYPGRGDMTLDELNETLKMINIHISSMKDLGLDYYGATISTSGEGEGEGEGEVTPQGLPVAPRGYSWRPLVSSDQQIIESLEEGRINVVDSNSSIPDFNGIYTPANGGSRTVYVPVTTVDDTTTPSSYYSNAEDVEVGSILKINNKYYRIGEPQGAKNIPTIEPIIVTDEEYIAIDDPSITLIEYSSNLGTKYLRVDVSNPNSPTLINVSAQNLAPVIQNRGVQDDSSEFSSVINSGTGNEADATGILSLTTSDGDSLTDGALDLARDSSALSTGNILNSGGSTPAMAVRGESDPSDPTYYVLEYTGVGGTEIYKDLSIDTAATDILTVTPGDLKRSISAITEDEVYTTEGLTDLGNTNIDFQTYLCNMAKNENYFYPISTLYSTNYLAIANYRSRLAQDSYKLYTSAPWDIDSGTVGFKFHACPSVIYWEAVSRNRSMNREFASVFGFSSNGQVLYTNPVTEFTKKQRQLLLSKQVNTVMWNTQNQTWNMNDCYTMTSENHILNEDGNSRLFIRINKAIPTLLRPLIGRKLNNSTYADAETILKYWFERTILTMQYSVSDYKVTISNLEANDDQARRQNKMYVLVECLFARSMKYVIVYSDALDMGMEFTGEIV